MAGSLKYRARSMKGEAALKVTLTWRSMHHTFPHLTFLIGMRHQAIRVCAKPMPRSLVSAFQCLATLVPQRHAYMSWPERLGLIRLVGQSYATAIIATWR